MHPTLSSQATRQRLWLGVLLSGLSACATQPQAQALSVTASEVRIAPELPKVGKVHRAVFVDSPAAEEPKTMHRGEPRGAFGLLGAK